MCFRPTGGCKWNSHEWELPWTGKGYSGETLQNERGYLRLPFCKDMNVHMSECLYVMCKQKGTSDCDCFSDNTIVLIILGCYFFKGES